jgi:predicted nucleic-acid-binding protein
MKTSYFDTNYILRLILNDNLEQCLIVQNLLIKARTNEQKIFISTITFCEAEWVLRSFYKFEKTDIINILTKVLSLGEIQFENFDCLQLAINNMNSNKLGFEDNYHISYCLLNNMEFQSFDKKAQSEYLKCKNGV